MSAVNELRAAAAKLREAKEQTSSLGPWRNHQMSVHAEDRPIAMAYQCYADAAWIALMHPGLAEPLAAWLEEAAETVASHQAQPDYGGWPDFRWCMGCQDEECDGLQNLDKALAVARAIAGGEPS